MQGPQADLNTVVGAYLPDLAFAQLSQQKMFGYTVTDHSFGLRIAGGMSMADAAVQRRAIGGVNARHEGRFRLLQGVEANIDAVGHLDLTDAQAATFDLVLAAPHSKLRKGDDQTDRRLTAVQHPAVRILAHLRGRMSESRAGVVANWDVVFEAAARHGVAIEIDGDAHTTTQLSSAETALTHARLAAIPVARIVNCRPLDRLLAWVTNPSSEGRVRESHA